MTGWRNPYNESSSTLELILMNVQNYGTSIPPIVNIWNNIMRHRAKLWKKERDDASDTSHIIIEGDSLSPNFNSYVHRKCTFVPLLWDMYLYKYILFKLISSEKDIFYNNISGIVIPDLFINITPGRGF